MKIKRAILMLSLLIFLTGCNANYNIEIYNNEIREKLEIIETDKLKFDSIFSSRGNDYNENNSESNNSATYRKVAEKEVKLKTPAIIEDNSTYYNKKLINRLDELGVSYNYKFTIDNYNKSFIVNSFYDYFTVLEKDKTYIISTSDSFNCFERFPILDNLTIKIETNHKVKNSNADDVDGYTYTWNIKKDNSSNKRIYIQLYRDKYVFNYKNRIQKILIGVAIGLGILFIIFLILRRKYMRTNR